MVLAKKSTKVGIMYGVITLIAFGGAVFMKLKGESDIEMLLVFIGVGLVTLFITIDYLRSPSEPIHINADNTINLPKGVVLHTSQIQDVSYKRASAKSIQYKWGSVTIIADGTKYKFKYINDCEAVAKELLRIRYSNNNC